MLNGRYDYLFPTETSQQPLIEALGTPAAQKEYVLHGGHLVPRAQLDSETLDWLDAHVGNAETILREQITC